MVAPSTLIELIVSPLLLDELTRALAYPRLRRRIAAAEAAEFVAGLSTLAVPASDPEPYPLKGRSRDPGDDL